MGWSQKNVIKVHVYKQLKKVRDDVSQDASLESLGITPDHMLKVIYKWQIWQTDKQVTKLLFQITVSALNPVYLYPVKISVHIFYKILPDIRVI